MCTVGQSCLALVGQVGHFPIEIFQIEIFAYRNRWKREKEYTLLTSHTHFLKA